MVALVIAGEFFRVISFFKPLHHEVELTDGEQEKPVIVEYRHCQFSRARARGRTRNFPPRCRPWRASKAWLARAAELGAFPLLVDNRGQLLGAGQLGICQTGQFALDVVRQVIAPALPDHIQRVHEF